MRLKCPYCNHIWNTRTRKVPMGCPYCKYTFYYKKPKIMGGMNMEKKKQPIPKGVGKVRDDKFLSQEDHEQAYAKSPGRKKPFKTYKKKK